MRAQRVFDVCCTARLLARQNGMMSDASPSLSRRQMTSIAAMAPEDTVDLYSTFADSFRSLQGEPVPLLQLAPSKLHGNWEH